MINKRKTEPYIIGTWILFFVLGFLAMREFLAVNILAYVPGGDLLRSKRFIAFVAFCTLLLAGWIAFYWLHDHGLYKKLWKRLRSLPTLVRGIISFLLIILPGLMMWIIPLPKDFTLHHWMMLFLFYSMALIVCALFRDYHDLTVHLLLLSVLVMAGGFGYAFLSRMNQVTAYPFTTYWSEGNRFFDYSTLLGSFRYIRPNGEDIQAFVNWGMALPWAIPFLLPGISIGFFRFWYQIVWVIPAMILGYVAINRSGKEKISFYIAIMFALWAYLFLDQGPIYPPLLIGAILTIIAVRQRLPLGILLVAAASYYVRSARWTWGYAPGLWAGMLALLSINHPSFKKENIKQLIRPFVLGLSGYFGGQFLPSLINVINRGTDLRLLPNASASTTRQPLLWDRLWPNPTYPPGIIFGLVWAVLPSIVFILFLIISKRWKTNWMQNLGSATVALAFLVVGVIASAKIGGGSNLHNLDMFLITVLFILSAGLNALIGRDKKSVSLHWLWTLLITIVIISPVTYALQYKDRLILPPQDKTEESYSAVRNKVEEYSEQGEILFIDHRQLLTFGLVKNVPLVDDYEKKYLMDWALTGNAEYFTDFYADLGEQRFALIVNEPLNLISRGEDYAFGEENDAYVKWVTTPLFCQYEPLYTSQATALELLIPRSSPPPSYLHCEDYFPQ